MGETGEPQAAVGRGHRKARKPPRVGRVLPAPRVLWVSEAMPVQKGAPGKLTCFSKGMHCVRAGACPRPPAHREPSGRDRVEAWPPPFEMPPPL